MSNIEQKDYYHGMLQREDMEELFTEEGDYLVRAGISRPGEEKSFIVSISLCSGKAHLKHFAICRTPNGFSIDNSNYFPDIVQLIEYYVVRRIGLNGARQTVLKRPINRASWELTHDQVAVGEKIGEGHFGSLLKGKLNFGNRQTIDVAVKMAKKECNDKEIKEMLKEARIMRGIAHPNIVRLYGVALDKEPFLIVMELMANGDLKTFLRTNRSSPYQKLCWAAHAAYGIAYMHTKYLIHRDIAARNCLLSSNLTLKIADFGLTREGGVYQMIARRKLPVKWIAPEVLENNIFTLKSDVWSFGILVWEIMSDGAVPYEGLPNVKVKEMMLQGKHNKFPPGTNAEVVKLVQTRCWMRDPASRCTMLEVAKIMARVSGVRPPPTRCLFSKELIATAKQPKMRSMKMKSATRKRNISN